MIPTRALAVRQHWAWAIFHADPIKDIDNLTAGAIKYISTLGPTAIHASAGMTRSEYKEASEFMATIGVQCPPAAELVRGGIIGHVNVVEIVSDSPSPWFFKTPGNRGLRLADAQPCDFIPVTGVLGYFDWQEIPGGKQMDPLPWMNRRPPTNLFTSEEQ